MRKEGILCEESDRNLHYDNNKEEIELLEKDPQYVKKSSEDLEEMGFKKM